MSGVGGLDEARWRSWPDPIGHGQRDRKRYLSRLLSQRQGDNALQQPGRQLRDLQDAYRRHGAGQPHRRSGWRFHARLAAAEEEALGHGTSISNEKGAGQAAPPSNTKEMRAMNCTTGTNERETVGRLLAQTKDLRRGKDEPFRSSYAPARRGSFSLAVFGPTVASDTIRFHVELLREIAREHDIEIPPPPSAGWPHGRSENRR
jgi:hypothetical protein